MGGAPGDADGVADGGAKELPPVENGGRLEVLGRGCTGVIRGGAEEAGQSSGEKGVPPRPGMYS